MPNMTLSDLGAIASIACAILAAIALGWGRGPDKDR